MRIRNVLVAAALGTALCVGATAGERLDRIEETKTLRVGTPGDYRPFAMKENGRYVGHDVELLEAMARAAGWKVEYVDTSWPKLSADFKADKFDVAMGGITPTVARLKLGAFLPGYVTFGKVALVNASKAERFTTHESLNRPDVRVIKNPGGTHELYVNQHLTQAQVTTHQKNAEIPGMIAEGKGDVMITDTMEAKLYAKAHPGKLTVLFAEDTLTPKAQKAFFVQADDPEYLRVMQYLWDITELRGERAALYDKWLK